MCELAVEDRIKLDLSKSEATALLALLNDLRGVRRKLREALSPQVHQTLDLKPSPEILQRMAASRRAHEAGPKKRSRG